MNTEIKTLAELPFIPAKIRDFAFQYSTAECRPLAYWAGQYGVRSDKIKQWLNRPEVQAYIQIVRDQSPKGYLDEIKRKLREKV